MSGFAFLLVANALAIAAAMLALWALSLWLRDASIVDIFWGVGFSGLALIGALLGEGDPLRRAMVLAMVSLWGLRLALHLLRRNAGHGEDPRYRAMRRRHGERFGRISLWTVFALQGAVMWIVALPVAAAQGLPADPPPGAFDALGAALWAAGLWIESRADAQLARFKADRSNAGRVMDRGLWAWTRHPNYFGDFLVWWGIYLVALGVPGAAWTVIGPLVMSVLLMRVSGVPLLERRMARTRPGYADYARRVPPFFPRPPRRT